jgi:hypothetical protein
MSISSNGDIEDASLLTARARPGRASPAPPSVASAKDPPCSLCSFLEGRLNDLQSTMQQQSRLLMEGMCTSHEWSATEFYDTCVYSCRYIKFCVQSVLLMLWVQFYSNIVTLRPRNSLKREGRIMGSFRARWPAPTNSGT